jgi:hypothetical protein
MSLLSEADKALYARQILLSELGLGGQERLTTASITIADDADPRARAVACEYLQRAGVGTGAGAGDAPAVLVPVPSAAAVQRVAADPALEECAAWLLGAYAAVEAIKARAAAGAAADFPSDYALGAEVQ